MEVGGRLGAHGHAFLVELARKAMKAGMHNRTFWLDSAGCLAKGEIAFRVAYGSNASKEGARLGFTSRSLLKSSAYTTPTHLHAATSSRLLSS